MLMCDKCRVKNVMTCFKSGHVFHATLIFTGIYKFCPTNGSLKSVNDHSTHGWPVLLVSVFLKRFQQNMNPSDFFLKESQQKFEWSYSCHLYGGWR